MNVKGNAIWGQRSDVCRSVGSTRPILEQRCQCIYSSWDGSIRVGLTCCVYSHRSAMFTSCCRTALANDNVLEIIGGSDADTRIIKKTNIPRNQELSIRSGARDRSFKLGQFPKRAHHGAAPGEPRSQGGQSVESSTCFVVAHNARRYTMRHGNDIFRSSPRCAARAPYPCELPERQRRSAGSPSRLWRVWLRGTEGGHDKHIRSLVGEQLTHPSEFA